MTTTVTISTSPGNPTPIAMPGDPPTLFANMSSNDTITISDQQSFSVNTPQVVTLQPGAFVVIAPVSELYASCTKNGTQMEIIPGGLSYAAPGTVVVNLSGINQNVNGNYQVTEPSGFQGTISIAQTDATSLTATTVALTAITKAYTIPVNDAFAGTIYKISANGAGHLGATAVGFSIGVSINGAATAILTLPASTFAASNSFQIYAEINCHQTSVGAGGNMNFWGFVVIDDTTTGNTETVDFQDTINTFDTLVANTISLFWEWTAITNAPTVTFIGSILERLGP